MMASYRVIKELARANLIVDLYSKTHTVQRDVYEGEKTGWMLVKGPRHLPDGILYAKHIADKLVEDGLAEWDGDRLVPSDPMYVE